MATIDWPTGRAFRPARMTFGASTPKSAWAGFFTGQSQSVSHLGDRLRLELTLPPCSQAEAGPREAFLMSLASTGDWVRLWHMQRPQPMGTLRGAPLVNGSFAAGARSIALRLASSVNNLLSAPQSFDYDNAWVRSSGASVNPNVAARPNNVAVTADEVVDSTTLITANIRQTVSVPDDLTTYTASIYVKQTTGGVSPSLALGLQVDGGTTVANNPRLNTDTGVVLSGTATVVASDGYWRISASVTNNGTGNTNLRVTIFPAVAAHGLTTADPLITGSAIVWGAQVERGSVATVFAAMPSLAGGDLIGSAGQLLPVSYQGVIQGTTATMNVPLALPLRQALADGEPIAWDQPTGNFQLLGDLSQVEYLPGRYQGAVTLQFVEAY